MSTESNIRRVFLSFEEANKCLHKKVRLYFRNFHVFCTDCTGGHGVHFKTRRAVGATAKEESNISNQKTNKWRGPEHKRSWDTNASQDSLVWFGDKKKAMGLRIRRNGRANSPEQLSKMRIRAEFCCSWLREPGTVLICFGRCCMENSFRSSNDVQSTSAIFR